MRRASDLFNRNFHESPCAVLPFSSSRRRCWRPLLQFHTTTIPKTHTMHLPILPTPLAHHIRSHTCQKENQKRLIRPAHQPVILPLLPTTTPGYLIRILHIHPRMELRPRFPPMAPLATCHIRRQHISLLRTIHPLRRIRHHQRLVPSPLPRQPHPTR